MNGSSYSGVPFVQLQSRVRTLLSRRGARAPIEVVEDIVQEALTRFLANGGVDSVDASKGTTRSLIAGYLVNVCFEHVRHRARCKCEPLSEDLVDDEVLDPDAVLLEEDRLRMLRDQRDQVLIWWEKELTERQRVALARTRGPMFGRIEAGPRLTSDASAAWNAVRKLRKLAGLPPAPPKQRTKGKQKVKKKGN